MGRDPTEMKTQAYLSRAFYLYIQLDASGTRFLQSFLRDTSFWDYDRYRPGPGLQRSAKSAFSWVLETRTSSVVCTTARAEARLAECAQVTFLRSS